MSHSRIIKRGFETSHRGVGAEEPPNEAARAASVVGFVAVALLVAGAYVFVLKAV